ncbi:MAG: hypothetical protein KF745_11875 [Phycisphaeraceae bacterium]|nr:hypothetical protein [Phycisphaeraceae bacterium]
MSHARRNSLPRILAVLAGVLLSLLIALAAPSTIPAPETSSFISGHYRRTESWFFTEYRGVTTPDRESPDQALERLRGAPFGQGPHQASQFLRGWMGAHHGFDALETGWPLRSLFAWESYQSHPSTRSGVIELPKSTPAGSFVPPHRSWIACNPRWPQLIANALAFAATLLGLLELVRFVRRVHRRHRGRCAHCGYDLRATPAAAPCPECGNTDRARLDADRPPRAPTLAQRRRSRILAAIAGIGLSLAVALAAPGMLPGPERVPTFPAANEHSHSWCYSIFNGPCWDDDPVEEMCRNVVTNNAHDNSRSKTPRQPGLNDGEWAVLTTGWPFRSFAAWEVVWYTGRAPIKSGVLERPGHTAWDRINRRWIACSPRWPQLLANALIFAAAAIGLLELSLLARRSLRRRRGRCTLCGYDLRATPPPAPCPECGQPCKPIPASIERPIRAHKQRTTAPCAPFRDTPPHTP